MAIRFGGTSRNLTRTGGLPTIANGFTYLGWCQMVASTGTWTYFASIEDGASSASNGIYLGWAAGGSFDFATTPSASAFAATPAVGDIFAWYIWTDGATYKAGWRKYGQTAWDTAVTTGVGSWTPSVAFIGTDSYDEFANARIWNVKFFDRALTQAEISREVNFKQIQQKRGINFHWTLDTVQDLVDRSGQNHKPVAVGALVTESANIIVPQVRRRMFLPFAPAGSGVTGTLAKTLGNDTLASSGSTTILGTLAKTLGNDTLAGAGTTTILGTLAKTLGNDTLAASGSVGTAVSGTLASTLANDTLAAVGTTTVLGSLARTLGNDTLGAAGTTTILGSLARTLGNDTLAASGAVGSAVVGTLSGTLANDTLASSGTTTILGSLARTLGNDTLAASGTPTIVGTLARTLGNDTLSAAGSSGTPPVGTFFWRWLGLALHRLGL